MASIAKEGPAQVGAGLLIGQFWSWRRSLRRKFNELIPVLCSAEASVSLRSACFVERLKLRCFSFSCRLRTSSRVKERVQPGHVQLY
jgi:hypothetical protein